LSKLVQRLGLCASYIALAVLSASGQTSTATNVSDQRILTQIESILHDEHAFDGMSISPHVSHGVVTLTGTVSSQAAKVLASNEIADVEGIKTVLNNLNVAGPSPRPTIIPMNPIVSAGITATKSVSVLPSTIISIRTQEEINTKSAVANDTFHGTVSSNVMQVGFVAIPVGTPALLRVIDSKPAGHLVGSAELSLELVTLKLMTLSGPQNVAILTQPLSSKTPGRGTNTAEKTGGGAAVGAVIGAIAGGGRGAAIGAASGGALGAGTNALTHGKEIDIRPEQLLQFRLNAPVQVSVETRGGRQVPPQAVTGPAMLVKPQNTADTTTKQPGTSN
jgi:hypothetical protein